MKAIISLLLLTSIFACQPTTSPSPVGAESVTGWIPLFNQENLEGWIPKINGFPLGENYANTFKVEDGVLKVNYQNYDAYLEKYGHLFYQYPFSHYRLRIEYRFVGEQAPEAPDWGFKDGGVEYHCQSPMSMGLNQGFPYCVEANLHGGNGEEERPTGLLCTPGTNVVIADTLNTEHCIAGEGPTFHNDEWIQLEIEVHGARSIKHFVNGQLVVDYTQPQLDPRDNNAAKYIIAQPTLLQQGYIALQSNSHPMEFWKIELMELPVTE